MDDLFDLEDGLDLMSPAGLALAVVVLDDDEPTCECWCDCRRPADVPDKRCTPCREDRHGGG